MNIRQPLALIGVLAALLVIAYGISLLSAFVPQNTAVADSAAQVRNALGLSEEAYVAIQAQDGDFAILGVYPNGPNEGGGYLSLVKRSPEGIREIYSGQDAPPCSLITNEQVPATLVPSCSQEESIETEAAATTTAE